MSPNLVVNRALRHRVAVSNTRYSVTINWICDDEHPNSVDVEFDVRENEDIDDVIITLVCDTTFARDNPCYICGDTVQQDVDWITSVIDDVISA